MNPDRFKTTNYINPNGLDRIIEFFTENSNRFLSKELSTLSYDDADKKWIATCASGSTSSYDGIVLTIPAPKVLQLQGNYRNYLPDLLLEKLATVQYSSR
jgi:predicted NAD/FAD-dependent oxidoreductase